MRDFNILCTDFVTYFPMFCRKSYLVVHFAYLSSCKIVHIHEWHFPCQTTLLQIKLPTRSTPSISKPKRKRVPFMSRGDRILACGLGQGRLYSHLGCIHYRPVRLPPYQSQKERECRWHSLSFWWSRGESNPCPKTH